MRALFILIFTIFLSGCSNCDSKNDPSPELKVEIKSLKWDPRAGDEIPIDFAIQNVGKSVYKTLSPGGTRWHRYENYALFVYDSTGKPVRDPREHQFCHGYGGKMQISPLQLKPRAIKRREILLNRWARITAADTYKVIGVYSHGSRPKKMVRSQPIFIEVLPRTQKEMRDLLELIKKRISTAKKWELEDWIARLAFTVHPDAIPIIIDAGYRTSSQFWRIETLVHYFWDHKDRVKKDLEASRQARGPMPDTSGILSFIKEKGCACTEKPFECWKERNILQRFPEQIP